MCVCVFASIVYACVDEIPMNGSILNIIHVIQVAQFTWMRNDVRQWVAERAKMKIIIKYIVIEKGGIERVFHKLWSQFNGWNIWESVISRQIGIFGKTEIFSWNGNMILAAGKNALILEKWCQSDIKTTRRISRAMYVIACNNSSKKDKIFHTQLIPHAHFSWLLFNIDLDLSFHV